VALADPPMKIKNKFLICFLGLSLFYYNLPSLSFRYNLAGRPKSARLPPVQSDKQMSANIQDQNRRPDVSPASHLFMPTPNPRG